MIFIARNYNNLIISIISCEDEKQAKAYWQGQNIQPHHVKTFDPNEIRQNEQEGYITPILVTKEHNIGNFINPVKIIQVIN